MPKVSEIAKLREELAEMRKELASVTLNRRDVLHKRVTAKEIPDPRPLEIPAGMEAPPSLTELVQMHVRGAMSSYAAEHELETFEEADDFEPEDEDMLPMSGYEVREYEAVDEKVADASPPPNPDDPPAEPSPEAPAGTSPTAGRPLETEPAPGPENSQ